MKRKRSEAKTSEQVEPRLPNAELDVLGCLWKRQLATAREIRETMKSYRPMAHGSVVTLLKRLEAKGLVTRRKGRVGKAFVYRATRRPEPTCRGILRNLLDRAFGGDGVVPDQATNGRRA